MLVELNISDFAIIDQVRLRLAPGMNVMTGETGAGKSIIIDALGAILGAKTTADSVRSGAKEARLEALFALDQAEESHPIFSLLDEHGLIDEEGLLILSREIVASGRSVSRVNGRAVNLNVLQRIGEALVDIHGQSEHLSLLRPSQHVDLLDSYAGLWGLRNQVSSKVGVLRQVRKDLDTLRTNERERNRRRELLGYQIEEIGKSRLRPGEEEELEQERTILNNAEKLTELTNLAYQHLAGGDADSDERGVLDLLAEVERALGQLVVLDPRLETSREAIETISASLQDVSTDLRSYRDGIEFNPARFAEIEERLDLLFRLKRKYGATAEEIIRFGREAKAELDRLEHSGELMADLEGQEAALLDEIGGLASELSQARQESGLRLAKEAELSLAELRMGQTKFAVEIVNHPDPNGVPAAPGGRVSASSSSESDRDRPACFAFDSKGIDKVEFLIAPNPGEPLRPLAKIASGGETARLMLALKSILSTADATPVLVFDEIDVGVGGRSGQVVGEKLWKLSRSHQVICISHLPQIAAFGDSHYRISKGSFQGRTRTEIEELSGSHRVDEIAMMIDGPNFSQVARQNAQQMLERIGSWKEGTGAEPAPMQITE